MAEKRRLVIEFEEDGTFTTRSEGRIPPSLVFMACHLTALNAQGQVMSAMQPGIPLLDGAPVVKQTNLRRLP